MWRAKGKILCNTCWPPESARSEKRKIWKNNRKSQFISLDKWIDELWSDQQFIYFAASDRNVILTITRKLLNLCVTPTVNSENAFVSDETFLSRIAFSSQGRVFRFNLTWFCIDWLDSFPQHIYVAGLSTASERKHNNWKGWQIALE